MNNEERLKNLGINIYYWRKKRGLTQKELAEKANVSSYVLSSFEKPDKNYVFSTGYAQMRPLVDGRFLLCLVQNEGFVKVVLDNCRCIETYTNQTKKLVTDSQPMQIS